MAFTLTRLLASVPMPTAAKNFLFGRWTKQLEKEFVGTVTDKFLERLLGGMDAAFLLFKDYRRNIEGFEGRYLFVTQDGEVNVAAIFKNGDMKVHENAIDSYDVKVTFKDAPALLKFLFSRNQDILNSLLANEVETDGNLNYLYKFGFMARDLMRRIGIQP